MRISLDQKIAGYPAIRIRELMRRTAGGPIMFQMSAESCNVLIWRTLG